MLYRNTKTGEYCKLDGEVFQGKVYAKFLSGQRAGQRLLITLSYYEKF